MPAHTTKHGSRGFTLAELAVSVAITAMIGSAVMGLTMTLSTANEHAQDRYLSLQTARMTMFRLQNKIHKAKLVTAAGYRTIVLWAEDSNSNDRINISEIEMIEFAPGRKEIRSTMIVFPKEWSEETKASLDTEVELDAVTQVGAAKWVFYSSYASVYERTITLADDVAEFHVYAQPEAPMAELVRLSIRVGSSERGVTLESAAHLRAQVTDLVGMAEDKYLLMTWDDAYLVNNKGP